MKILTQLVVLFVICLVGRLVSSALPVAFPASVMATLIMLGCLLLKLVKPSQIKEVSEFLLSNMAFFFIPAGVGILAHYGKVEGKVMSLLLICTLITLITFLATAYTVMLVVKIQNRRRRRA